jgi:hypothetical protein
VRRIRELFTCRNLDSRAAVNDHIAHLAVWEATLAATLRGDPPHAPFGVSTEDCQTFGSDELRINEFFYRRWRNRSLVVVRAESERVHSETVASIERIADADPR